MSRCDLRKTTVFRTSLITICLDARNHAETIPTQGPAVLPVKESAIPLGQILGELCFSGFSRHIKNVKARASVHINLVVICL